MLKYKAVRKDILVFLVLLALAVAVFNKSFFSFFAQDDFILINHFSQYGFLTNLGNVFGTPTVTHWRPIHNLYFFISGGLFGKNYLGYHLLTLIIHITGGFFIYKTMILITKKRAVAISSAVFYLTSPVHFVSLYWISGGATLIGFTLFIASFYFYIGRRFFLAFFLFVMSCLASESMVVGALIFLVWELIFNKLKMRVPLIGICLTALLIAFTQLTLFKPASAIDAYRIELSPNIFSALRYYLLRLPGFIEGSGFNILSGTLILWLLTIGAFAAREITRRNDAKVFIFAAFVILIGLFPFVLIPNHLSPHYINISLWGASIFVGYFLGKMKRPVAGILLAVIVAINFIALEEIGNTHWVIQRGKLAKSYLEKIQNDNVPSGARLIFGDNRVSTSLDAYYALGTGKAIDFWFKGKNYKTCFSTFENCGPLP